MKLVDLLEIIAPDLGSDVSSLGDAALSAMEDAVAGKGRSQNERPDQLRDALECFAEALGEHHSRVAGLPTAVVEALPELDVGASESIQAERVLFSQVVDLVDRSLGTSTPAEVLLTLRQQALDGVGLGARDRLGADAPGIPVAAKPVSGRFLDTEIVAIYW